MKKIKLTIMTAAIFLFTSTCVQAQKIPQVAIIDPYRLNITFTKTTNLIFPFNIQSVDRGSPDVLAQKAKGVENILEIKAGKRDFEETNLTVVTTDGKLYSYLVNYTDTPAVLNLQFSKSYLNHSANLSDGLHNNEELKIICDQVASEQEDLIGKHAKHFGVSLELKGVYIYNDIYYLQFILSNETNVAYGIDQFRFFIRDQKKAKRTAVQELELQPVYTKGNITSVPGQSYNMLVFALPKFTIPDQKNLEVQVIEKDGGRHLEMKTSNNNLLSAKKL